MFKLAILFVVGVILGACLVIWLVKQGVSRAMKEAFGL